MNEDIKRIFIDTVTTYNYSDKIVEDSVLKDTYDLYNEVQKKTGGELYNSDKKIDKEPVKKVFETPTKEQAQVEKVEEKKSVEKLLESYKAFEIDLAVISSWVGPIPPVVKT